MPALHAAFHDETGRGVAIRRAARSCAAIALLLALLPAAAPAPHAAPLPARAAAGEALGDSLEAIRARHGLPALGAALVTLDDLDAAVTGLRRLGGKERVGVDDRWHLGSCTKAMTATLIGLLVDDGTIERDEPLAGLLPDLAESMHAGYREVTLAELLSHKAGVGNDHRRDGIFGRVYATPDVARGRTMLVEESLRWEPLHARGSAFAYSNFGYVIAGRVAEAATGESWEALMRSALFEPLGMTSAGFGAPGDAAKVDAPFGHHGETPVAPGLHGDNPAALGPAGTVHCSLSDWAKFIRLHLKSATGDVKVGGRTLTQATARWLHAPPGPKDGYAMGWGVGKHAQAGGDGAVWMHDGSNTMWFSRAFVAPGGQFAALVVTNSGDSEKWNGAAGETVELLLARHAAIAADAAAKPSRGGGE